MSRKERYQVYIENYIGVKTNFDKFKWSFGSNAPEVTQDAFDKCLIKVNFCLHSDRHMWKSVSTTGEKHFGRFHMKEKTLFFRDRKGFLRLAYTIKRHGNEISVDVGKTYYNLVRYKVMNYHPIWYIVFDYVTEILLENHLTPIYCSAIQGKNGKATLFMAPPNVGKSFTVYGLSKDYSLKVICEDMAITDGKFIFPAKYTNTYRDYKTDGNNTTKYVDTDKVEIERICILEKGNESIISNQDDLSRKILVLNRYGLGYLKSPILSALDYFGEVFPLDNLYNEENQIIRKLNENSSLFIVRETQASKFADLIYKELI